MKRGNSAALCILVGAVVMLGLAPGCAGKSIARNERNGGDDDDERGGSTGTTGKGGSTGTTGKGGSTGTAGTGTSGTGGTLPNGGSGGGGVSGTSGTGGVPPSCGQVDGPIATPSVRPLIPFEVLLGEGGEGGQGGADGEGGGELNGCLAVIDGHECFGMAQTTKLGTQLSFQFEDGSSLEWRGDTGTFVAPPQVANGTRVYIEYERQQPARCPSCSVYAMSMLTVRTADKRQRLWFGLEGSLLEEVSAELVEGFFGAPHRRVFGCVTEPYYVDCYTVTREIYHHVLETMPEQWISHATPTVVETPRGTYDVMWASASQSQVFSNGCAEGRPPARDRGIALSRLDPEPF
jgi:hypothetical protein